MKLFRRHLKQICCPLFSNSKNRLCGEWKSVVGVRLKKGLFALPLSIFNNKGGVIDTWINV